MPNTDDMRWFKEHFQDKIEVVIAGTPLTVDLVTALACQETGEVWPVLRKTSLSLDQILELCVGDTHDANKGRKAFPRTKADLIAVPHGSEMFDLARQALIDMAQYIAAYRSTAAMPDKFCHAFGIFQFDLQFFLTEPDYFLQKQYANFDICLRKCLGELQRGLKRLGFENRTSLSDLELGYVAIAYNTGGFNPAKGLKQGYFDGVRYYGEQIFSFLQAAQTVQVQGNGALYLVDGSERLRLRGAPSIDPDNANSNLLVWMPKGQVVRAFSNQLTNGFLEVETDLDGKHYRGYASRQYLQPA